MQVITFCLFLFSLGVSCSIQTLYTKPNGKKTGSCSSKEDGCTLDRVLAYISSGDLSGAVSDEVEIMMDDGFYEVSEKSFSFSDPNKIIKKLSFLPLNDDEDEINIVWNSTYTSQPILYFLYLNCTPEILMRGIEFNIYSHDNYWDVKGSLLKIDTPNSDILVTVIHCIFNDYLKSTFNFEDSSDNNNVNFILRNVSIHDRSIGSFLRLSQDDLGFVNITFEDVVIEGSDPDEYSVIEEQFIDSIKNPSDFSIHFNRVSVRNYVIERTFFLVDVEYKGFEDRNLLQTIEFSNIEVKDVKFEALLISVSTSYTKEMISTRLHFTISDSVFQNVEVGYNPLIGIDEFSDNPAILATFQNVEVTKLVGVGNFYTHYGDQCLSFGNCKFRIIGGKYTKNNQTLGFQGQDSNGIFYISAISQGDVDSMNQLTVDGAHFEDNVNGGGCGTAISIDNTVIEVMNSKFVNNHALGDPNIHAMWKTGAGGAICVTFYNLAFPDVCPECYNYVQDSVFEMNSAGLHGGAIYGSNVMNMEITNSKFISNNATRYGGSIFMYMQDEPSLQQQAQVS